MASVAANVPLPTPFVRVAVPEAARLVPKVRVAFTVNVVLMVAACAPAQTSRASVATATACNSLDILSSVDLRERFSPSSTGYADFPREVDHVNVNNPTVWRRPEARFPGRADAAGATGYTVGSGGSKLDAHRSYFWPGLRSGARRRTGLGAVHAGNAPAAKAGRRHAVDRGRQAISRAGRGIGQQHRHQHRQHEADLAAA